MTATPLPSLQFAVLGILRGGKLAGRQIRRELSGLGIEKAGPTFYRLMARMEEGALIRGWYEQDIINQQIHRERVYEALPDGLRAWDRTREFHESVIRCWSPEDSEAPA